MRRAYSSSRVDRAPAGAAAARQNDDDEDDFPLLRQNAAGAAPAFSEPIARNAPLPLARNAPLAPARQPKPLLNERDPRGAPQENYNSRVGGRRQDNRNDAPQAFQNDRSQSFRNDRSQHFGNDKSVQQEPRQFDRPYQPRQRSYFRKDDVANSLSTQNRPASEEGNRLTIRRMSVTDQGDRKSSRTPEKPAFRRPATESYQNRNKQPDIRNVAEKEGIYHFRPSIFAQDSTEPAEANGRKFSEPLPQSPPEMQKAAYSPLAPPKESISKEEEEDLRLRRARRAAGDDDGNLPLEDEHANTREYKPSFKKSGRFQLEEEEEETQLSVDLPATRRQSQPYRAPGTAPRRQSQAFDFDIIEAEQALNGEKRRRKKQSKPKVVEPHKPTLTIPEFMTVQQLAQSMKIKVDNLIQKLEEEGFEGARYDHMLDAETSAMFADIYGFEAVAGEEQTQDLVARPPPEDISILPPRPPIVTIMGHVDHGKTTILDWLRKSSVAAGEHGGITQHIGAFSVTMPGTERQITFLDTPGHEAFLDMRRRGATVTDIVVLVVAADDSVKPQTIEAIKHALEARVQLIVAINKVDKHDANIEQVKQDLTQHEIVVEDYGGDYQAIPVSGKTGQGMENLEEAIITLADVLDLRAEQDGPAEGQILESKVTNAGRVATVLIRRGVLRVGDFIVAGSTWGRVRTLRNDSGQLVQEAYPGDPVQVDGWRGSDPTAGLEVLQADNEQHAKEVIDLRLEREELAQATSDMATMNVTRAQEAEARSKVLEWEAENKIHYRRRGHDEGWKEGAESSGTKEVHFVIKADVAGSVEAIVAAVSAIGNHEVRANVIHSGTGPVTESDIRMLATTGETGYAISFNQPVDGVIHSLAQAAGLNVIDQNIIYKVTDMVKEKVEAALPPLVTQRVTGEAEIGKIFDVTIKKQTIRIAGCKVTNGTISRSQQIRVIREGETVYTGTLESLKHIKKDVTEMRKGTECGLGFKDWADAQEGDSVQCFEEKVEARKLY